MHGEAYLRKALIPHVATTLEEYLWLASQLPVPLLDTVPPDGGASVRAQLLAFALDLDVTAYPPMLALIEGRATPPPLQPEDIAARRAAWAAADLMVAMKQIRYRFQATEALLEETPEVVWGHPTGAPTPLAHAVFALWRQLLARLATLADTVAALDGLS